MLSDKRRILHWFYRQDPLAGVHSYDSFLRLAAEFALGMDAADAAAYTQRNATRSWSDLLASTDVDLLYGRSPVIASTDRSQRQFEWEALRLLRGVHKERSRGQRLLARAAILRAIDNLGDRAYEALGCVISKLIGATHVRLTPSGGEGGIDFFAYIPVPGPCHVFGGAGYAIRVVGQSKKYTNKLPVDRVRDFCQTLSDIRHVGSATEPMVPAWFRASKGPILGWMVAHSGAQSGALTRANNQGLVISDSVDFSEVAALARRLDIMRPVEERAQLLVTEALSFAASAGTSAYDWSVEVAA